MNRAPVLRGQGWNFIEENVQSFLQGDREDHEWSGHDHAATAALPIPAANSLVPGSLKIVGPDIDLLALEKYMKRMILRAHAVGVRFLVFGSGAARNVPVGFDRKLARCQIADFARMSATIAQSHEVTLVAEHLRQEECNIVNTIEEAMSLVRTVDHPNFKCLVDSYHLWSKAESLDHVKDASDSIRHVHVADLAGRVAPGLSGESDYRPLFRILADSGYDGRISVEASNFNVEQDGERVLAFLQQQWSEATR